MLLTTDAVIVEIPKKENGSWDMWWMGGMWWMWWMPMM
jgi:hypothetical protein